MKPHLWRQGGIWHCSWAKRFAGRLFILADGMHFGHTIEQAWTGWEARHDLES